MKVELVTIGLIVALFVVPPVYATVVTIKSDHYTTTQSFLIICLCWMVPFVGPAIAIAAYRSFDPRAPSRNTENDGLNRPDRDYVFIPGSTDYEGGGGADGGGD